MATDRDYENMVNARNSAAAQQVKQNMNTVGLAGESNFNGLYYPQVATSLREEAERRAKFLSDDADKAYRAVAFFRAHPEFDEFIRLIRQGVIGI